MTWPSTWPPASAPVAHCCAPPSPPRPRPWSAGSSRSCSLLRRGYFGDRALHGHPAQQRALDARGVLGDALEGDGVVEFVLIGLGHLRLALRLHQREELLLQRQ